MRLDPPFIIAVLVGLTFHECAHAWVAYKLGDPTAKYDDRITLNPIAHIDLLGAIFFLIAGFGWGKPVPVNPRYFDHPRRDSALVSLAGPLSNLIVAIIAGILLRIVVPGGSIAALHAAALSGPSAFLVQVLMTILFVNLSLMAFNLLPIAPLDGSKVLQAFVPLRFEDAYEQYLQYGMYVLFGLLILERVMNVSILSWWIESIVGPILQLMGIG